MMQTYYLNHKDKNIVNICNVNQMIFRVVGFLIWNNFN